MHETTMEQEHAELEASEVRRLRIRRAVGWTLTMFIKNFTKHALIYPDYLFAWFILQRHLYLRHSSDSSYISC